MLHANRKRTNEWKKTFWRSSSSYGWRSGCRFSSFYKFLVKNHFFYFLMKQGIKDQIFSLLSQYRYSNPKTS